MNKVYCTTYCNKGHDLKTGRPVDHECMIIPTPALQAELEGDYGKAIQIIERAKVVRAARPYVPPAEKTRLRQVYTSKNSYLQRRSR